MSPAGFEPMPDGFWSLIQYPRPFGYELRCSNVLETFSVSSHTISMKTSVTISDDQIDYGLIVYTILNTVIDNIYIGI